MNPSRPPRRSSRSNDSTNRPPPPRRVPRPDSDSRDSARPSRPLAPGASRPRLRLEPPPRTDQPRLRLEPPPSRPDQPRLRLEPTKPKQPRLRLEPPPPAPPRRPLEPPRTDPPRGSHAPPRSQQRRPPEPGRRAAQGIAKANREHPADAVLREVLRSTHGLPREISGEVARLVFRFYRWHGLLSQRLDLPGRIRSAGDYAARFVAEPASFDAAQLARIIPPWTSEHLAVDEPWLRSIQGEPSLWLRARPGTGAALATELGECEIPDPARLPDALIYRGATDLFRTAGFQAGRFELQDVSSQIVGHCCGPQPRETWWDACAGEGGKTLLLADLLANTGTVWATDRAEWRLDKLRLRAGRAGIFNIRWKAWDGGARLPVPKRRMDGVLLDAPCSGIGTWQRNPQARWTTTPDDIRELARIQADLLRHAAEAVRPGGRLVYAVCTLTRDETSLVAEAFTRDHPDFEPMPVPAPWSSPVPVPGPAPSIDAVESVPLDPAVAEPASAEPAPIEPAPIEPAPIEPAPIEPAAMDAATVDPVPVETVAVEPVAVDPVTAAPLPAPLPAPESEAPTNHLWLRAQPHGGNGMFVALWRRRALPEG